MNINELFYYYLGIYRGQISVQEADNQKEAYFNFTNNIYNIFSGCGKIHQYFLDNIIEKTINTDGDIIIDEIKTEEIVDEIIEYYTYNIVR